MKRFSCNIDWSKGLMSKLAYGLKHGMWFQRYGEQFFVPAKNIKAYFESNIGCIVIYFHTEKPFATMATYSIFSYRTRWATKKSELRDLPTEIA